MGPVLEFADLLADGMAQKNLFKQHISYLAFLLPEDDYLDYCPALTPSLYGCRFYRLFRYILDMPSTDKVSDDI